MLTPVSNAEQVAARSMTRDLELLIANTVDPAKADYAGAKGAVGSS